MSGSRPAVEPGRGTASASARRVAKADRRCRTTHWNDDPSDLLTFASELIAEHRSESGTDGGRSRIRELIESLLPPHGSTLELIAALGELTEDDTARRAVAETGLVAEDQPPWVAGLARATLGRLIVVSSTASDHVEAIVEIYVPGAPPLCSLIEVHVGEPQLVVFCAIGAGCRDCLIDIVLEGERDASPTSRSMTARELAGLLGPALRFAEEGELVDDWCGLVEWIHRLALEAG